MPADDKDAKSSSNIVDHRGVQVGAGDIKQLACARGCATRVWGGRLMMGEPKRRGRFGRRRLSRGLDMQVYFTSPLDSGTGVVSPAKGGGGLDYLSFSRGSGDSFCDGPMVSEAPTGGCTLLLLWLCRARRSEVVRSWRRKGMIYMQEASGRLWSRDGLDVFVGSIKRSATTVCIARM